MAALSSGLVLAAGCGDDDGNGNMNPVADSGPDMPDAAEPDAAVEEVTHSGVVAITEVTVTDPEAQEVGGLSGASVNIGWSDDSTATVEPVEGFESNLNGCQIFVYNADDELPDPTDEGAVTVTGTASGEFACAFTEGEYRCQSTDAAAAGEVPAGSTATLEAINGQPTPVYTITDADFSNANYAGMWITISGFADDSNANGTFPILGVDPDDPSRLFLGNPNPPVAATAGEGGTYATAVGAGPVPGGFDFLPAEAELTIAKPASDFIPELDVTIQPNGEGFELDETSAQPHAVPTDCSAVTFACPGGVEDGDCGGVGETPIRGMIISGSTTDADVDGLRFNEMPAAINQYATFQCSAIAKTGFEIPAEAMQVILGTNPSRIQFNVTYAAAALEGNSRVVAGHTLTGFTDVVDTTGCDQ